MDKETRISALSLCRRTPKVPGSSNCRSLKYALLILPFLRPMGLQYSASGVLAVLAVIFQIAQMCVAIVAICSMLYRRKCNVFVVFVIAISVSMLVSALYSADYTGMAYVVADAARLIGFACLVSMMMEDNPACLIEGAYYVTAALTALYISSAILFIAIDGGPAPDRIYAFGGKNSILMQAIPYFTIACIRDFIKRGGVSLQVIIVAVLYSVISLLIDSVGSLACFILLLLMLVIYYKPRYRLGKLANGGVYLFLLVALFLIVFVFKSYKELLEPLFGLAGRSPTFSGRETVWNEAFEYLSSSPIFGAGPRIEFHLISMQEGVVVTPAAHSFFLDGLARYGLLYFIPMVAGVIGLYLLAFKKRTSLLVNITSGVLFVLLVHSLFDTLNEYILLFSIAFFYYVVIRSGDLVHVDN